MKKLIAILLSLTLILCLFAGCGKSAAPAEVKTFIMGIDAEYPPFSYMDDSGNYTGFDVEICKAACDKLGWEMKIFPVNWDNKLIQLDAGECDCVWSGMTILDSMKDAGYEISAPYYDNTQELVREILASNSLDGENWPELKNTIRDEVHRFIFDKIKRNPMILPIILDV